MYEKERRTSVGGKGWRSLPGLRMLLAGGPPSDARCHEFAAKVIAAYKGGSREEEGAIIFITMGVEASITSFEGL